MVESDDEFTELCTKLLKRVKKSKPSEGQSVSTASTAAKSKLKKPKVSRAKSKASNGVSKEAKQIKAGDGLEKPSNEAKGGGTVPAQLSNEQAEKDCSGRESQEEPAGPPDQLCVKDLVLERMQQYKRASPVRMKLNSLEANEEQVKAFMKDAGIHTDRDLAMALQMDLKEPSTGLEDEGLFFCQLCQKDLTAMSSVLREQHVNRCLDQSESSEGNSASSVVPPSVPSCPLCGKPFTTEKARASHLKRCAVNLEVPAQMLLQAVQKQAADTGTEVPTGVAQVKRKGVQKKKEPSKKRKVAKTGAEMEDLMVAMALSRSLQEENPLPTPECVQPARQIGPTEKKSRRKKKDKPPPVLLVQAPEEAVHKLQKRLSLLLSEEPVVNDMLTLPASSFWNIEEADRETWRMRAGKNCVLWDISNMMEKRDTVSYYIPELNPPIAPWKPLSKKVRSSQPRAVTPTTPNLPERVPESQKHREQVPSPATPHKDHKPLSDSQKDRQAFLDLAELAGEGMTLTQWNYAPSRASTTTGRESPTSIECSGFIPSKEEATGKESKIPDTGKNAVMTLIADFMEMVNNPHLSDAQLQTDCGEVLYVHMFVMYARCPLLVEAIHSEGFYVDEGSTGRVRRLLLNDVSVEAALCFLRFLYSAKIDIPNHCLIHVCELARRFGVKSLLDTCELLVGMPHGSEDVSPAEEEEEEEDDRGEREENFLELLKSMWVDEDEDLFADQEAAKGLEEEEKVDDAGVEEVDLEEIYEFAATQRRMPEEQVTEPESSSELDVGYQDKESEEPLLSIRSQAAGQQPTSIVNQQSLDCHYKSIIKNNYLALSPVKKNAAGSPPKKSHSNSLGSSPAVPLLASPSPTKTKSPPVHFVSPVQSPSKNLGSTSKSPACQPFIRDSKQSEGPSAELSQSSSAAVHTISLISPEREEDPEADLFAHHSPAPLDDSYDRIFSETCGEYIEPSGLCETSSCVRADASHHREPPVLTSSPSVIQHPTLPELGSSPNIQLQTQSSSFAAPDNASSPTSFCKDPKYSERTQNSSKVSSSAVSQEQDIILILSSDEETEDGAQTAGVKAKGNISALLTNIKDSPGDFSIRRNSEGQSLLDKSSGSEMSWLVPATPMAHGTGMGISVLQTSHTPQSPKTSKTINHDDSQHDLLSPTQRNAPFASSVTNTTKITSFAMLPSLPKTPEKIVKCRHEDSGHDDSGHEYSRHDLVSPTQRSTLASSVILNTTKMASFAMHPSLPKTPEKIVESRHDDSRHDLVSPTQRSTPIASSVILNTTKMASFAMLSSLPKTPEKIVESCHGRSRRDHSQHDSVSPTQKSPPMAPSVTLNTTKMPSFAMLPPLAKTPEKIVGSRHDDSRHDSASPTQKSPPMASSVSLNTTKMPSFAMLPPLVKTPEKIVESRHDRSRQDRSRHNLASPTQRSTPIAPSVTLNTTKMTSFATLPSSPKTPEKIVESRIRTSSKISCVRSSPISSVASSTVFEVVDSDEEETAADPQADTSACSFQMDYDEPPMPIEDDLWLNAEESPLRTYSSPDRNASLHINATPTKAPGTPCSTSGVQERHSTPDNREDSSQSKQSSYLNSKLWDEWEEEEHELPAILPLSQRLNKVPDVQKLLRTPVSIVRKRELPPKVAITPLPDYSDMDTPVLKKELNRFGVRALPKKQMVLKLKEIFSYTHQVMSSDSEDDAPSSQPSHRNRIAAVQGPKKQRAPATSASSSTSLTKPGKKKATVCAAQEADSGDEQPPTASQESTTSSVAASDTSSISQSSNTNEFETAFADEDDDDPVPASQAANKEAATADAVRRFIESHPDLHKRILLYEPLDLAALHADLKQSGIKIAAGKLLDFLDVHCVTFTTATARKEKMSRRRKKTSKKRF